MPSSAPTRNPSGDYEMTRLDDFSEEDTVMNELTVPGAFSFIPPTASSSSSALVRSSSALVHGSSALVPRPTPSFGLPSLLHPRPSLGLVSSVAHPLAPSPSPRPSSSSKRASTRAIVRNDDGIKTKVFVVEQAPYESSVTIAERDERIRILEEQLRTVEKEKALMLDQLDEHADQLRIERVEMRSKIEEQERIISELRVQLDKANAERQSQESRIEDMERSISEMKLFMKEASRTNTRPSPIAQNEDDAAMAGDEGGNSGKSKAPGWFSEDEEEEVEEDIVYETPNKTLPLPINHGRPRGGGGPRYYIRTQERSQPITDSSSAQHVFDSGSALPTFPRIDTPEEGTLLQSLAASIIRLNNILPALVAPPSGRKSTSKYKLPAARDHNPERTQYLAYTRLVANELLGITKDAEFGRIGVADIDSVSAFEDGLGEGPQGRPMKPHFEVVRCRWNESLAQEFVTEVRFRFPSICTTEGQADLLHNLFIERLERLRKHIVFQKPRIGETEDHHRQRLQEAPNRRRRMQRPCSRRDNLWNLRMDITRGNLLKPDQTVDEVWDFLHKLASELTLAGMSSDETDTEARPHREYWVRKRAWRSRALIDYLKLIDNDHNVTTEYGNIRPGNTPRVRKRRTNASVSIRAAVPGLPLNFYDDTWYNGLSNRDKRMLGAKPAITLPEVGEIMGQ